MKGTTTLHVVLGLVLDDHGNALFTRRHDPDIPEYDGYLEIPGGKVEPGETSDQAARREVLEETGFSTSPFLRVPFTFPKKLPQKSPPLVIEVECWLCRLDSPNPVRPHEAHQEPRWIPTGSAPLDQIMPGSREFLMWAVKSPNSPTHSSPSRYGIELEAVDPERNKNRNYFLEFGFDPTADCAPFRVTRMWGRIDTSWSVGKTNRFENMADALKFLEDSINKRRRNGYQVVCSAADHPVRSWLEQSGIPFGDRQYQPTLPLIDEEPLPMLYFVSKSDSIKSESTATSLNASTAS